MKLRAHLGLLPPEPADRTTPSDAAARGEGKGPQVADPIPTGRGTNSRIDPVLPLAMRLSKSARLDGGRSSFRDGRARRRARPDRRGAARRRLPRREGRSESSRAGAAETPAPGCLPGPPRRPGPLGRGARGRRRPRSQASGAPGGRFRLRFPAGPPRGRLPSPAPLRDQEALLRSRSPGGNPHRLRSDGGRRAGCPGHASPTTRTSRPTPTRSSGGPAARGPTSATSSVGGSSRRFPEAAPPRARSCASSTARASSACSPRRTGRSPRATDRPSSACRPTGPRTSRADPTPTSAPPRRRHLRSTCSDSSTRRPSRRSCSCPRTPRGASRSRSPEGPREGLASRTSRPARSDFDLARASTLALDLSSGPLAVVLRPVAARGRRDPRAGPGRRRAGADGRGDRREGAGLGRRPAREGQDPSSRG